MQLDSNVAYVHGQNPFCFKFVKYLVVLILLHVIYEEICRPTFKPKHPVVLLKIGKGQKWYQIFGTKVYNHQNGIIMQIKAWKLDHEFIIWSSLKYM